MMDEDQHEIRPGEITDFGHGCCFAMMTIVLIVLAAVVTIFCMEATGPLLLSDLRNWIGNNRENMVTIYTLRTLKGQQFWTVEFLPEEEA